MDTTQQHDSHLFELNHFHNVIVIKTIDYNCKIFKRLNEEMGWWEKNDLNSLHHFRNCFVRLVKYNWDCVTSAIL